MRVIWMQRRVVARRPLPSARRWHVSAATNPDTPDIFAPPAIAFEGENAGDDVVDERAIVADEQQRARELGEQFFEQLQRLGVEIVGGFVEHQQVGRLREQLRHQQTIALAA